MYLRVKSILDVLVAACVLVAAMPVIAAVAVAIRVCMGSPVLFRQRRPGLDGRPFECIKFRTMADTRDEKGCLLSDQCRTGKLGALLRRSSLDELPQLWNIVRRDMSFIGPRPLLWEYLAYYSPDEQRRHAVRPGLTGWAQIHGRNCLSFDARLAMDVWYVDHVSFSVDLRILLATIWLVLSHRDVRFETVRFDDIRRRSCV